ncbi:hypothetical protein [Brevundimonas aurifodinae]|uniref:Uncharacterized protein n=2 Tax=Brevundimonas TaxID=41275 RepID=A0ABV1NLB8_9CAUL
MQDHGGDFKARRIGLAADQTPVSDCRMIDAADTHNLPRSRLLLIGLIVGSLVALLAILPAFIVSTMSVMVAASGTNPLIYTFILFSFGLPIVTLLGPILAWIAFAMRRERTSWALLLSPILWAGITFGLLALAPGG